MDKDKITDIADSVKDIKSKIEYESKFALEHRNWMVGNIEEIKEDIKGINGRVRKTEVAIGWLRGVGLFIGGVIGWLVKKQV